METERRSVFLFARTISAFRFWLSREKATDLLVSREHTLAAGGQQWLAIIVDEEAAGDEEDLAMIAGSSARLETGS